MVELDPLASVSILGKPGQLPAVLAEKHRELLVRGDALGEDYSSTRVQYQLYQE